MIATENLPGDVKMLGDPMNPFFAFDAPQGRVACLLDRAPAVHGEVGFDVLTAGLDQPSRGAWRPLEGTLALDGVVLAVAACGVETARAVCVDADAATVVLCDPFGGRSCDLDAGSTILYPGWFDSTPAGSRLADLAAFADPEDGPFQDDDEIDWADHHVAETRALARAHAAF